MHTDGPDAQRNFVWTSQLDKKLVSLVEKFGKDDWPEVCARLGLSKSCVVDCFNRWLKLSPAQFHYTSTTYEAESPSPSPVKLSVDCRQFKLGHGPPSKRLSV